MTIKDISGGVVHKIPSDLRKAFALDIKAVAAWESLTPLARNEWICWVESVKQQITREQHIKRAIADLTKGKRRPCCWYGCIHRTDKNISPSVQGILSKRKKST